MQTQRSLGIALFVCGTLLSITGCVEPAQKGKRVFLSVDFKQGQTLRYRFRTEREIITDWAPDKQDDKSKKKSTESVDMVVAYEPVEVDPYGLTKIKVTFESIKAKKTGVRGTQRDAAETLKGKSYSFSVGADGKIHDRSELIKLLTGASKSAFRQGGATKDPDLLDDVLATQWYLWDSLSSINKPSEGLKVGQTWKSHILIPTSMVLRIDRDVTYQLAEVHQTEHGDIAVIKSTYSMSEAKSEALLPYEGSFRLSGAFGFFRAMFKGLSITSLEGGGEELFNIDAGKINSSEQNYKFTLKPNAAPLPGANPIIYIDQKMTMKFTGN